MGALTALTFLLGSLWDSMAQLRSWCRPWAPEGLKALEFASRGLCWRTSLGQSPQAGLRGAP